MFAEIEKNILRILSSKMKAIKDIVSDTVNVSPAVFVHIENGTFKRENSKEYKVISPIFVTIKFKGLRSREQQRHGIYSIVLGVAQTLMLDNLGMIDTNGLKKITPLEPVNFQEITTADDERDGNIVFQIQLKTSFNIEKTGDGVHVNDLLTLGIEYFLTPVDDNVVDAGDNVTLPQS